MGAHAENVSAGLSDDGALLGHDAAIIDRVYGDAPDGAYADGESSMLRSK